jgi:hypothetical protein
MERLRLHILSMLRYTIGISFLEKARGHIRKPLGVNCDDFTHVLLCGEHQVMVKHPFWLMMKESGAWMNENGLLLDLRAPEDL